jgi:hypothetical protein
MVNVTPNMLRAHTLVCVVQPGFFALGNLVFCSQNCWDLSMRIFGRANSMQETSGKAGELGSKF